MRHRNPEQPRCGLCDKRCQNEADRVEHEKECAAKDAPVHMSLTAKSGFDWSRVRWDDADKPQRDDCSYCGTPTDEDECPLRMWDAYSNGCVFCNACAANWFGLQSFPDPIEGLDT